ncbi:hypothetical protein EI546_02850 [Aequorivita sp. H23M31]|uniref:Cytochrome C oxidase subunit IV n=1 Tax=Aequorivita ciconiae TaxID=2494375 RepID=A0A410G0G9_9FLAO|nr:cytochrome C oxidase subunit IV family protein [Aequorivita sp. H23M31]QAA80730.1 hypothetical protein EI546_02850 [Aequorivita sp. H23M31]
MERTFNITWFLLIGLTLITAIFSSLEMRYVAIIILGLALLKFIGVAFFFMELKKANVFWRILLVGFLLLLLTTVWAI